MTIPTNDNESQEKQDELLKQKELNFKSLKAGYERQLEKERQEKEQLMQELQKRQVPTPTDDDEDYSDPYVDHRRLKKEQAKFGQQIRQETQSEIQKAVQMALEKERQDNWIKQNPDFYETMNNHSERFAQSNPLLADTILKMPEGFERQKLVYANIKALGFDKPIAKEPSIQEKIDANRRAPYYQPSGESSSPYGNVGDFSQSGQKQAFDKMQELKKRLRLG